MAHCKRLLTQNTCLFRISAMLNKKRCGAIYAILISYCVSVPRFPLVACTNQSSFPKRPISFVPYHLLFDCLISVLIIISLNTFWVYLLFRWIGFLGYVQWMSFERSVFRKTRTAIWWFVWWRSFIVFIWD